MKTLKKMGYAGAATLAMTLLTPATTMADSAQNQTAQNSSNVVHRVSHTLANTQEYSATARAGAKWGKEAPEAAKKAAWAGSTSQEVRSGYKWEQDSSPEQSRNRWRRDHVEQSRNRWRRDHVEQSRNRWRRDHVEQSRNRWRRDHVEQSRNRWRR
jgi:hypothetical protein